MKAGPRYPSPVPAIASRRLSRFPAACSWRSASGRLAARFRCCQSCRRPLVRRTQLPATSVGPAPVPAAPLPAAPLPAAPAVPAPIDPAPLPAAPPAPVPPVPVPAVPVPPTPVLASGRWATAADAVGCTGPRAGTVLSALATCATPLLADRVTLAAGSHDRRNRFSSAR